MHLHELCGLSADEFWHAAEAGSVGLGKDELARVLLAVGVKYNYGVAPGVSAARTQIAAFWQSLQLRELALAHACALGRDAAWQQFMPTYKASRSRKVRSASLQIGHGRAGTGGFVLLRDVRVQRQGWGTPVAAGLLFRARIFKGFLRAALAQRHVDYHPAHFP